MEAQIYQQALTEDGEWEPLELLLATELAQLNRDETDHLEKEFAEYDRLYPRQ